MVYVYVLFAFVVVSFVAGALYGRKAERAVVAELLKEYAAGQESLAQALAKVLARVKKGL